MRARAVTRHHPSARAVAGRTVVELVIAAIAMAALVVACGPASPTSGPPTARSGPPGVASDQPAATPSTAASRPSAATATPTAAVATPSTDASMPASGAPAPSTVVDAGLLAVLPETVGGVPIVATPEASVGSLADPAIVRSVARLATGYAVSASGDDWAVVSVVTLRPGTWSDAFYRGWRDSYGAEVCKQAGGVGSRAIGTIGGREVDIATCGGLRMYHVHLGARDIVVSVTSAGEGRFGEQVMAGLRP